MDKSLNLNKKIEENNKTENNLQQHIINIEKKKERMDNINNINKDLEQKQKQENDELENILTFFEKKKSFLMMVFKNNNFKTFNWFKEHKFYEAIQPPNEWISKQHQYDYLIQGEFLNKKNIILYLYDNNHFISIKLHGSDLRSNLNGRSCLNIHISRILYIKNIKNINKPNPNILYWTCTDPLD